MVYGKHPNVWVDIFDLYVCCDGLCILGGPNLLCDERWCIVKQCDRQQTCVFDNMRYWIQQKWWYGLDQDIYCNRVGGCNECVWYM